MGLGEHTSLAEQRHEPHTRREQFVSAIARRDEKKDNLIMLSFPLYFKSISGIPKDWTAAERSVPSAN